MSWACVRVEEVTDRTMSAHIDAEIILHESASPAALLAAARAALRRREIPHALHYESDHQAALWQAVHRAHSPWIRDEACRQFYRSTLETVARRFTSEMGVLSLGCGTGEKDALLLDALLRVGARPRYRAHDVSRSLVMEASERCRSLASEVLRPVVAALPPDAGMRQMLFNGFPRSAPMLTLMFGLSPNFEPADFFAGVACIAEAGAVLLSANLAAGADYSAGVAAVLPQYDNPETRAWLMSTMAALGFSAEDGALVFRVSEPDSQLGVRGIDVRFELSRSRELTVLGERFSLVASDTLRVFYSYRYTATLMETCLRNHGLALEQTWISPAADEGIFLVRKQ